MCPPGPSHPSPRRTPYPVPARLRRGPNGRGGDPGAVTEGTPVFYRGDRAAESQRRECGATESRDTDVGRRAEGRRTTEPKTADTGTQARSRVLQRRGWWRQGPDARTWSCGIQRERVRNQERSSVVRADGSGNSAGGGASKRRFCGVEMWG